MAKVDVTKEAELAKEYFVQGYPTLIIFKNGDKLQDYTGEKNAEAIISHMTALNDPNWVPPPSDILGLTAENFTKFVKNEKLSLVLFYAPWCKHCKQVFPGTDIILNSPYLLAAHMHVAELESRFRLKYCLTLNCTLNTSRLRKKSKFFYYTTNLICIQFDNLLLP